MPYEIMDQIGVSSNYGPSFFSEEVHFPAERQVGFWKPELMQSHPRMNGVSPIASNKYDALLPVDKIRTVGANSVDQYEVPQSYIAKDQKAKINVERHLADHERTSSLPMISWKVTDNDLGSRSSYVRPPSVFPQVNKVDVPGVHYENSLFSSSLSEMFAKKLRLPLKDVHSSHSVDKVTSHFEEDEPFESAEEIEAHTIGTLLPDDDDLLSGVLDELEYIAQPNFRDDIEDFDLFSSGEGMELEADDYLSGYIVNKSSDCSGGISNGHQGGTPFAGEHPYGEHPSRTLFVRNINSNVEDSELKVLFEQYGDIRTLYTACKHRGFVMISYYDIRSARNAMKALQHTPLRRRKLDIHFSIPKDNPSEKDINQGTLVVFNLDSSVSNDDLRQIFGVYGEIKEIRETPHKRQHKFIEFYDVRAAEEALRALNQTDIAGKRIKVEPSRPGGARRCLMQQLSLELEHEEAGGCLQQGSPPSDSLSGSYGSAPHGVNQGLYSASGAPMNPFTENEFHGISSSVPHSLSSPVRVAPVGSNGNQSGFDEHTHSLGQMKFYFQSMPSFHPHSLPEYHGSVTNSGIPYKSPGTTLAMATNMNFQTNEGVDSLHMHIAGPGGINMHSFELNKGVFGSSGNGSCPLHGQHSVWGNSNSYQPPPPGPLMLPNSPSFTNAVHAHPQHQLHGLPRAPSHMMNTFAPLPGHHHVGSAPAFNPSLWDQRHLYVGDSTEPSGFHPGSLGSLGFSGSSNLHPLELATHNMLPHVAGNCMNPSISSANVGMPSPQQRTHMFPGRSLMIPPMATSFDGPNEHRTRSRRGEANFGQADNKKQYELNIDRIMHREDTRTTLMIKNIPNKYTSKMLLATIDEHHRGTYDFIYLPIDFKNKCNVGYAFINMIDPVQIVPFYQAFNGKKWEKFNSEKVASLAYARIQGKTALIAHFQNSSLMNEDKRCRPILFHTEGPNAGDQEPFPMGINIRSRPGKTRTNIEETHLGSPLAFGNVEEFFNGAESLTGSSKDLE